MFHGGVRSKKVISFFFFFWRTWKNFFLFSVGWTFGFWVHRCSGHVLAFEHRLYTKFPAISLLHVLPLTSGRSVIFSCPQHFGSQGLNLLWNQSGFRMKGALGWTFPWDKVRGPGPSGLRDPGVKPEQWLNNTEVSMFLGPAMVPKGQTSLGFWTWTWCLVGINFLSISMPSMPHKLILTWGNLGVNQNVPTNPLVAKGEPGPKRNQPHQAGRAWVFLLGHSRHHG